MPSTARSPRRRVALILFASLVLLALHPLLHADERNFGLLLNYGEVDEARGVDGQALGATLLYGFDVNDTLGVEARLTGLVLERGEEGGTDFYQQDIGVDAVYRFGHAGGWRPYVLAGIAWVRNDVETPELDDTGFGASLGAGIDSAPLGRMGLRFRAELRYLHDSYLDGMQDARIGLGFLVPLDRPNPTFTSAPRQRAETTADTDSDGILDNADQCGNTLPYVKHDEHGCMQPGQVLRLYSVTFDNGTAVLTTAAREELQPLVQALRDQRDLRIRVVGHTDSLGDRQANLRLSRERAEAVATHLVLQGIATQRIDVDGRGESQPVESNTTARGRERNRRIEIVLLEPVAP